MHVRWQLVYRRVCARGNFELICKAARADCQPGRAECAG